MRVFFRVLRLFFGFALFLLAVWMLLLFGAFLFYPLPELSTVLSVFIDITLLIATMLLGGLSVLVLSFGHSGKRKQELIEESMKGKEDADEDYV
jgi:hypothetical protein